MTDIKATKENRHWDNSMYFKVWQLFQPDPRSIPDIHYSHMIEINIFENVFCDAYINGKYYSIKENCVAFVPPNAIHSFIYYTKSPGVLTSINIDPDKIARIFNINELLSAYNISYLDIPIVIHEFDEPYKLAMEMKEATEMCDFIIAFSKLFKFFCSHINHSFAKYAIDESKNEEIMNIIAWTKQNMSEKISLDEISNHFGYSKSYFCKKFKKNVGISYIDYLTNERIQKACKLLKLGYPVNNIADMCGFEDTSYFIYKFRKRYGITPKTFGKLYKDDL